MASESMGGKNMALRTLKPNVAVSISSVLKTCSVKFPGSGCFYSLMQGCNHISYKVSTHNQKEEGESLSLWRFKLILLSLALILMWQADLTHCSSPCCSHYQQIVWRTWKLEKETYWLGGKCSSATSVIFLGFEANPGCAISLHLQARSCCPWCCAEELQETTVLHLCRKQAAASKSHNVPDTARWEEHGPKLLPAHPSLLTTHTAGKHVLNGIISSRITSCLWLHQCFELAAMKSDEEQECHDWG